MLENNKNDFNFIIEEEPERIKATRDEIEEANEFIENPIYKSVKKRIEQDKIIYNIKETNNPVIKVHLKTLEEDKEQINKVKKELKEKEIKEREEDKKLKKKRKAYEKNIIHKYALLTINPPECDIKTLDNIIKKLKANEKINIYSYVYEQRGGEEETKGEGKHIHMIIDIYDSPSNMINKIFLLLSSKKNNYLSHRECVDIKYGDEGLIKKYLFDPYETKTKWEHYMQGNKHPSKIKSYMMTMKWRKENKIKDIYKVKGKISEYIFKEPEIMSIETKIMTLNNDQYIILCINGEDKYIKL